MFNSLKSNISFWSTFNYVFKTIFKNFKVYVLAILIPTFIFISAYLIKTSFGNKDYTESSGQIFNLFIIPFTFSLFTFSLLISNWEQSILVKQAKIFAINKFKIYFSILICTLLITFLSLFFCLIIANLIDSFLYFKNFQYLFFSIQKIFFINNNVWEYFNLFFCILNSLITSFLYMLCLLAICYLMSMIFKNLIIIQSINLIIIIFFLLLGDCLIDINLITNNRAAIVLNLFGYLMPIKSFQWLFLSSITNITMYKINILQTIVNPKLEIPFTFLTNKANIILPITYVMSLLWISFFTLIINIKQGGYKKIWKK